MTRSSSSPSLPASLAGVSVALALVLLACATTPPVVSDGPMAQDDEQRAAAAAALSSEPTFTPFTVAPEILNRSDVAVALNANYPEELRNAGIGGTALLFLFIDDEGRVQNIRIHQTSGFDALDQAALRVARVFEFSPAMNRDERVPVWIQIPVTFTTR
jgi:protein TonB